MRTKRTSHGALIALLALAVAGCGAQLAPKGGYGGVAGVEAGDRSAEYRVRCGQCGVTFRSRGGMESLAVQGSWNRSLAIASGDLLSIRAETRDGSYAEVSIRVGGREVATDRIEGGTAGRSASASYLVP